MSTSSPKEDGAMDMAKSSALRNPADSRRVIIAALGASTIGVLFYNALPLYLGTAGESKSLTSEQIGLIGTAFFLGFNIAGLSAFAWVRRVHWRNISLTLLPIALFALYWSDQTSSYPLFLVATTIGGAAYGGLYCIAAVVIGDTTNPERWYGVKTAVESIAGMILLTVLTSNFLPSNSFSETAVGMGVATVLLAPLLLLLPRAWQKAAVVGATPDVAKPRTNLAAVVCALLVVLVFYAGNSGIWAFAERMGANSDFDPAAVGGLLGLTLLFGIGGSLVVAAIGHRLGSALPFAISAGLVIVALICLSIPKDFNAYAVGMCLYMIGWSAGVPLALAEVARLDGDGRYVALGAPALGIGSMIGPGVAGMLYQDGSPIAVLIFSFAAMLASIALLIAAGRLGGQATSRPVVAPVSVEAN
jgi:predicted MFS family arabinose efflux permease